MRCCSGNHSIAVRLMWMWWKHGVLLFNCFFFAKIKLCMYCSQKWSRRKANQPKPVFLLFFKRMNNFIIGTVPLFNFSAAKKLMANNIALGFYVLGGTKLFFGLWVFIMAVLIKNVVGLIIISFQIFDLSVIYVYVAYHLLIDWNFGAKWCLYV